MTYFLHNSEIYGYQFDPSWMTLNPNNVITFNPPGLNPNTVQITATGSSRARTLADRFSDTINLLDYVDPNPAVDATAGVQAAITAARYKTLLVPARQYVISSTITGVGPITVVGMGNGGGPGEISEPGTGVNVSEFICSVGFTSGDMFYFPSEYPVNFRDIQFSSHVSLSFVTLTTRGSGAALHLVAPNTTGGTNANSSIERVSFSGFDVGIYLERCVDSHISHCYFQAWKTAAIDVDTGGYAVEASPGQITFNKFFGDTTLSTAQQFGVRTSSGYGSIAHNLFVGSQQAIYVNVSGPVNLGSIMITDNSIEEQGTYSINVAQTGSTTADAIQIHNNEFSNITRTLIQQHIRISAAVSANLYSVSVTGNKFQSFLSGGAGICVNVNSGNNVLVAQNQFVGSGYYTVVVGVNVTNCAVLDNICTATGLLGTYGGYSFQTSTTLLRDLLTRAIAVANLNAHSDGSQVYVTDGKQSLDSGIVVAGGAGCVAVRNAGVWVTIPILTTSVRTNGASGPTWTAGTGAPAATQPLGSMWSRTDGGVGTTLYVSRGGGTWNPVAGV